MTYSYRNPKLADPPVAPSPDGQGYTTYQEIDTRVPPKPSPVLETVSVDGITIPEDEILREAQHHPASSPDAAVQAAARALVVRQLLLNEAERLGLLGVEQRADGGAVETPEDAAIREVIEREVEVPQATEAECCRYYEGNRQKFRSEPLYEARHILVAAPESDDDARSAARARAQEICNRLAADPSLFAGLAEAYSACPSGAHGGNLGQLAPGSTVPEFESTLAALAAGEITRGPVATRFGYHVIALDRAIEARQLPFEAVRERIAAWLEAQAWSRAMAQYVSILAGRAEISGVDIDGAESPLVQ